MRGVARFDAPLRPVKVGFAAQLDALDRLRERLEERGLEGWFATPTQSPQAALRRAPISGEHASEALSKARSIRVLPGLGSAARRLANARCDPLP